MSKQAKTFAPSAMNIAVTNSIVQSLDALSLARDNWEQTTFKKANEGLYDLLSQCQGVFETKFIKGSQDDKKTLRNELITRLSAMKIKTQKNSPTLTLFVRYVFSSDRKRAHGYSYVLNAAISHEIAAAQLPQWIVSEGGIEEIKRKMVQSDEAKARRVSRALRHGTVWVNDYGPYKPQAEWGGFKASGVGRELGEHGLSEFLESKHIWTNNKPAKSGWFAER